MAIYDVTVVGAGPVGLMLATELAVAGVSVQVLERRAQPEDPMKAQSINVPTAEALDRRGLLSAAEAVQRDLLERMDRSPACLTVVHRPRGRLTPASLDTSRE